MVVTQAATGQPFTITFPRPPVGQKWKVLQIRVEIPQYSSGAVKARLFRDGVFVAGTNQGQEAVGTPTSGTSSIVDVHPGHTLTVTWEPTNVPGIVQGRATLVVDQVPEAL